MAKRKMHSNFHVGWTVDHDPKDLCGGRILQGRELARRKDELEKDDRERRALEKKREKVDILLDG